MLNFEICFVLLGYPWASNSGIGQLSGSITINFSGIGQYRVLSFSGGQSGNRVPVPPLVFIIHLQYLLNRLVIGHSSSRTFSLLQSLVKKRALALNFKKWRDNQNYYKILLNSKTEYSSLCTKYLSLSTFSRFLTYFQNIEIYL